MKNQTTTTIFTVIIIALVGVLAFGLIGGIFGKEEEVDTTPNTSRPAVTEPATEETEEVTEAAREITFTVVTHTETVEFTTLEGTAWAEFIDSFDNNIGLSDGNSDGDNKGYVYFGVNYVIDDTGAEVKTNDLIRDGVTYTLY